jgi:hypothetical protein
MSFTGLTISLVSFELSVAGADLRRPTTGAILCRFERFD